MVPPGPQLYKATRAADFDQVIHNRQFPACSWRPVCSEMELCVVFMDSTSLMSPGGTKQALVRRVSVFLYTLDLII
jgi:hypothetical protein